MAGISKLVLAVSAALFIGLASLGSASAQDGDLKQIKLTEELVKKFISAQKLLKSKAKEIEGAGEDETKMTKLLTEIANKAGFASFEEYDVVAANVTLIMAGIDPESGDYQDPREAIKLELKDVREDKSMSEAERKKLISELEEAQKSTPDVKFPENIALVKKYAKDIEAVLE